jgi:hypothetical protein
MFVYVYELIAQKMRFHWWGTCLPAVLELSISTWIFARLHLYLLVRAAATACCCATHAGHDGRDAAQRAGLRGGDRCAQPEAEEGRGLLRRPLELSLA